MATQNEMQFQETRIIKDGVELGDLIDRVYKRNKSSRKEIFEKIPLDEVVKLLKQDNLFFLQAAKGLSYQSLSFVIDIGLSPFFRSIFTQGSEIMDLFVKNLDDTKLDDQSIQKIIVALLYFNEEGVQEAIIKTGSLKLAKLLLKSNEQQLSDEAGNF